MQLIVADGHSPKVAIVARGVTTSRVAHADGYPMMRFQQQKTPAVDWSIALSIAAVFVADWLTPLGVAVWMFYLVPLGLSMLLWQPQRPLAIAAVCSTLTAVGLVLSPRTSVWPYWLGITNRSMLIVGLGVTAAIGQQYIIAKLKVREQEWVRAGHALLSERLMQGDGTLTSLADTILRTLCPYLDAPVAALYGAGPGFALECLGSYALGETAESRNATANRLGLLKQAAKDRRITRLDDVPGGYLTISSALGRAEPRHLVVLPAIADGSVTAVVEFGFLHPVGVSDMELLSATAESIAVAIRSAQYRTKQAELLAETQRQAEELRVQQEELRTANNELEARTRALSESQALLETQQAELEQTNSQLELQTQILEEQKDKLSQAHLALMKKADELALASRYKSEFLANMSHELRTPLNSALILAKLLADNKNGNLGSEEITYANTIYSAGNDLLTLINDILDLSRIEAGRMDVRFESLEISPVIAGLVASFKPVAEQKGLEFEAHVSEGAPASIVTDTVRLQQILRNLLSNAFKFTDSGTVSLEVSPYGEEHVAFFVRDTGIGISEEQQGLIFEAFRQANGDTNRKYGGTGLGLTISRELTRHLHGELNVQSSPGEGSVFCLVLPVNATEPSQRAPSSHHLPPRFEIPSSREKKGSQSERAALRQSRPSHTRVPDDRELLAPGDRVILVIEDDPVFAGIVADLARERGFRALIATEASDGIQLAVQHVPNAVLLDVRLPDNTGLVVLEHLKRTPTTRHVPVHIISAVDYTQQALQMGAIGYSLKPVAREQLVTAIENIEARLKQEVHRVLLVERSSEQREATATLLESKNVTIVTADTGVEALRVLHSSPVDCIVIDLELPDMSGFDLLAQMAEAETLPPIIVYAGRALKWEEEERLRRYTNSIIVKGAKSPERLLDEVTLFLHQVEANLAPAQQRILRELRSRDAVIEGKTILVVDDDARNLFALAGTLESRGAKPLLARNGAEALATVGQVMASQPRGVDLVLMDIMMPEMDGLTAIRELRKHPEWRRLPIIALTAKALTEDRSECLAAGADDYVAKPLDIDRLLSLIRVWINK